VNFIFLLILIAGVGWIIWRWRVKDKMDLERAWRLVLEDPNYRTRCKRPINIVVAKGDDGYHCQRVD